MKNPDPIIVTKCVRHDYTSEERNTIGSELARQHGAKRSIETEFDQVKASYKSKVTEAEAKIECMSTQLVNGFEMRNQDCRVVYLPKERRKQFFLVGSPDDAPPVLVEDMDGADFQAELLQAESAFELREEIPLFPKTDSDIGILVVGRAAGRWYAALRVVVGKHRIAERLDTEQKAVKKRTDAVRLAAKRAQDWLNETLGKDNAKGFEGPIQAAIEPHKEREE